MTATSGANGSTRPVGVVFVHGIGSQPQSATLREFAQPLIDWLEAWHRARGIKGFHVRSADLSYGNDLKGPARLSLDLPAHETWPARTWILAEGWWATRLIAPDYARMLAWSFRILWRTIEQLASECTGRLDLFVQAFAALLRRERPVVAKSDLGPLGWAIESAGTFVLLFEYVIGAFLGYALLIVLYPLSFIPLQSVRDFILIRLVRAFLVDNVGDFQTFVDDDVQALNIRRSVREAIAHLVEKEDCESVVVAAHSQGAVVAFDALTQRAGDDTPRVKKLITFGGALNKAFLLAPMCERLQGTLQQQVFWLDVWSYDDPVPGGTLVRAKRLDGEALPELVDPAPELRRAMGWSKEDGDGPQPRKAVNRMSVFSDHGGYWANWEHFTQRVAQEVDCPDTYYKGSRFFSDLEKERSRRRRLRVTTLVSWRLAAIVLCLGALIARAGRGASQLESDGRAIADALARIPGAGLLQIPGQILSALGTSTNVALSQLSDVPVVGRALSVLAAILDPAAWAPVGLVLLALGTFATLFAAMYLTWARFLFDGWDERERHDSVAPDLMDHHPRILLRSLPVLASLAALAYLVATP